MKKYLFLLGLITFLFSGCEMLFKADTEEYCVSGHVYYPDSITPICNTDITVTDEQFYMGSLGVASTDKDFDGETDETGYFEIVIPNGGKSEIRLIVNTRPDTIYNGDTVKTIYQYRADTYKAYSGKHGFENLKIYTQKVTIPHRYPYCEPSVPYIGDSFRIVAVDSIQRVELIEDNSRCLLAIEYQEPDTTVMFFVPDCASVEKDHSLNVYWKNGAAYKKLHLREHEQ